MMDLIAQAASASDAVPAWVGSLSGSAVLGVILYYVMTTSYPRLQEHLQQAQDRFHAQLDKERESREKMTERTFQEHREAIKSLIERDEKKHEQLLARIDNLPNMMRPQL